MSVIRNYARRIRQQPIGKTAKFLFEPKKMMFHLSRILAGNNRQIQNFYRDSSRESDIIFCAQCLNCSEGEVDRMFQEIENDERFLAPLRSRYRERRQRELYLGRFRCWWTIVRFKQPRVIIETGVHDGLSSTLILYAIHRNGRGQLTSIDLPSIDLPAGVESPGWLVPAELRKHWDLRLGDAKDILPKVLKALGRVDMFIHDSDHSVEHQRFELTSVMPFINQGGWIFCDDPHIELIDSLARDWSAQTYVNSSNKEDVATDLKENPEWNAIPSWARADLGSAQMSLAAISLPGAPVPEARPAP
jgi:hypothetical protein